MPAVTRKMADLKDKILSKIDKKFNELKLEFSRELKDQIKKGVKCRNEELEQYGRRCCLRIEGVPSVENESLDDVLGKVKFLITESRC